MVLLVLVLLAVLLLLALVLAMMLALALVLARALVKRARARATATAGLLWRRAWGGRGAPGARTAQVQGRRSLALRGCSPSKPGSRRRARAGGAVGLRGLVPEMRLERALRQPSGRRSSRRRCLR